VLWPLDNSNPLVRNAALGAEALDEDSGASSHRGEEYVERRRGSVLPAIGNWLVGVNDVPSNLSVRGALETLSALRWSLCCPTANCVVLQADPRRRTARAGARCGSSCAAGRAASGRLIRLPARRRSWRRSRQAAAFRSGKRSVSLL